MASRPPQYPSPDTHPAADDGMARRRWLFITFHRLLGVGLVLLGLSVLQGLVDLADVAGYAFLAVGLVDIFVVPLVLARMWRTPVSGTDPRDRG